MAADNAREFFETLEARSGDSSKAAGLNATYLFDISGAGKWTVRVENGKVSVQEGEGEADTTISASDETFVKIVNGRAEVVQTFKPACAAK